MTPHARVVLYLLTAVTCVTLLACGGAGSNSVGSPAGKRWYEGGTLHKKSALDWQEADAADKLATCGDFVANAWQEKMFKQHIQAKIHTVEDMKPFAEELVRALDAAMRKDPDEKKNRQMYTNQKVVELAAANMLLMGWTK